MSFQRILVAIDELDHSKVIFGKALSMAENGQASLMLLSCIAGEAFPRSMAVPVEGALYSNLLTPTDPATSPNVNQETQRMRALLKPYYEAAQSQNIPTQLNILIGRPSELICQVAQDWQADLIVMGRRGLKGWSEAVLGSTSNYVLHHAPCSVLVVQGTGG